jgi:hypothetical protein
MRRVLAAIAAISICGFALAAATVKAGAYAPTDAERARWTMSDLTSLATAVEAYAIDHHHTYPTAAAMADLVALIQPIYIRTAPASDAWGHAFVYVPTPDGHSYKLVSAGADGKTDPTSWGTGGPLSSFDEDAVLDSGSMTRPWPFR